jgi:hypothetical protein
MPGVYADLMMGRPTPTQAECNDIKEGQHLRTKAASGAPAAVWPSFEPFMASAQAAGQSGQAGQRAQVARPARTAPPPRPAPPQPPQPQPPR